MKSLPVIGRELRSEARLAFTYWLRVISAASALGLAVIGTLDNWQGNRLTGNDLFEIIQPTVFSLIWIFGPIMTCDSISRERREGTLGLLLLTALRPVDVGLAKALSGILRSASVVLAVLPMLAVALLIGGVSKTDLIRAALMDLMALLAAIGAGLLASSRCRQFNRAAILGLFYSALALLVLGSPQSVLYLADHVQLQRPDTVVLVLLMGPWVLCAGLPDVWRQTGAVVPSVYLWLSVGQVLLAAWFLFQVLTHLNRSLRRLALDTGRTARQQWWWEVFCTPRIFVGWLRRRHDWLLNRNPIGWLQRRTWSARLCTWGWLGVVVLVETAFVTMGSRGNLSEIRDGQLILAAFLAVGMAFSAADSFRQERETGALELLLVTPLTVRQVIVGRLFGVWGQYALVFALIAGMWCVSANWSLISWGQNIGDELGQSWFLVTILMFSTFLLVPVIGLNQSMVRRHFVTSWIVTFVLGVGIPIFLPVSALLALLFAWFQAAWGWQPGWSVAAMVVVAILLQASLAAGAMLQLYRNLNLRGFATGS